MALIVKEYLVIETWNGDGYSYENDAAIFRTDDTAKTIAHNSLKSVLGYFDLYDSFQLDLHFRNKRSEYIITYHVEGNSGSISVLPYKGQYGVMILIEKNKYVLFNTEEEYNKAYSYAVENANPTDYQLGDTFISAHTDSYSRQFRKLK